jgi:diguanylate cyclase (GGDEF)-like protein/putative nucleotidyltransferase with HDIG domain
MERFIDLPAPARVYVAFWWVVGLPTLVMALVGAVSGGGPGAGGDPSALPALPASRQPLLLPLLIGAFWLGATRVSLVSRVRMGRGSSMSIGFVTTYLALLFLGNEAAILAAAAGEVGRGVLGRKTHRWYQILFNLSANAVAAAVAGWVYQQVGGIHVVPAVAMSQAGVGGVLEALNVHAWRALMSSILVFYMLNTLCIATVISLSEGEPLFALWRGSFLWTAPGYFAAASVAGVVRALFLTLGTGAFLTALPIAALIYISYRNYQEKVLQHEQHIERLKEEQQRLDEVYHSALESLALAIDAKDKYTRKHISRVQIYAVAIARYLGVTPEELQAIRTAALLHDIGKLAIPENILVKPGKLTQEEFRRMQTHVTTGAMILQPVDFPWPVIPIVETHHERWDGNGYPHGLKGEEIPLGGRIVCLADFFDAVTSDRPYHRAMSTDEAFEMVRAGRGTHFDPTVVDTFFAIYDSVREEIAAVNAMEEGEDPDEPSPAERKRELLRALDEVGRASDELYALYETVQPLGRSLDLQQTLQVIVDKTRAIVPFDTCAIFWLSMEGDELQAEIVDGLYRERLSKMTIKLGEGLSGWVARHGAVIRNKPASMDIARKLSPEDEIELNSSLVVPLVLDGRPVGTLSLYCCTLHFYTEEHQRLLTIVADHAAAAIENARCFEETRELALTDALTGLPNGRALAARLAEEIDDCRRDDRSLGLVLLDLDNFKEVNDRLGHVTGDRVLREIAAILTAEVAQAGFVCRYAGDEFVVVLPGATAARAMAVAAALKRAVADHRPAEFPAAFAPLGASAGTSLYPDDAADPRALIHRADRRMYHDKFDRRHALSLMGAKNELDPLAAGSGRGGTPAHSAAQARRVPRGTVQ